MGISKKGSRALDWLDPIGLFPHGDDDLTNKEIDEYGRVVGFGVGPDARAAQNAYMASLRQQQQAGNEAVLRGIAEAEGAGSIGRNMGAQGFHLTNSGRATQADAMRGFTEGVAQGQRGIIDAAAVQGPSQALIQQGIGLNQARQAGQQLATTMSRGGNAALAQRAAQQAMADQSFNAAQGAALIRAQEQEAYNQRQLAAQNAAAQLGLAGASGLAGIGADQLGKGTDLQKHGVDTVLGGGIAMGQLGNEAAGQAGQLGYNYGTAQVNTDTGFAASGQQQDAAREAGNSGLLSGLLGALI